MNILTIPCTIPSSFKLTVPKVELIMEGRSFTSRYPVIKKAFPSESMIQVWIRPYSNPKYEYIIVLKPVNHIPVDFRVIHQCDCLVEFMNHDNALKSNLYVKLPD